MRVFFFALSVTMLTFCLPLAAQNINAGARSQALGNASSTLTDLWAAFNNQAGLGWQEHIEAGVFYKNRFLLPETHTQGLALALPFNKIGVFGVSLYRFGYSLYNENKFGLAYSRAFGKRFSIGIQINLHYLQLGDIYGSKFTATGELGVQVKITDKWIAAAHVFNPTRTPLADYNREKISTIIKIGTSYQFSKRLLASIEVAMDIAYLPNFKAGVEYRIVDPFFLRVGINTLPVAPTFGCGGIIKKHFYIDASAFWHPQLGFIPQLSLSYKFFKEKKAED